MTPEIRLVQSVVIQALQDAVDGIRNKEKDESILDGSKKAKDSSIAFARQRQNSSKEALGWIMDDSPRVFGFLWCCEMGILNADIIRKKLYSRRVVMWDRQRAA